MAGCDPRADVGVECEATEANEVVLAIGQDKRVLEDEITHATVRRSHGYPSGALGRWNDDAVSGRDDGGVRLGGAGDGIVGTIDAMYSGATIGEV